MTQVAIVSTVRAPEKELLLFVDYHSVLGINLIILFFDDPTDPALRLFSDYPKVVAIGCSAEYWCEQSGEKPGNIEQRQVINANVGRQLAGDTGCEWIIHIDSDELLFSPDKPLGDILNEDNVDVWIFSVLEVIPEKLYYNHIFQPIYFKKEVGKSRQRVAKLLCGRNVFYGNRYFRGQNNGKAAINITSRVTKIGIHGPLSYPSDIRFRRSKNISLLHFDCVGIDNWSLKWSRRLDKSGRSDEMGASRRAQFAEYIQAAKNGEIELQRLYSRIHIFTWWSRFLLQILGMAVTIRVDLTRFHLVEEAEILDQQRK